MSNGATSYRQLGIVDCDIHPMLPKGRPLLEYIPQDWRQRMEGLDTGYVKLEGPRYRKPHATNRVDATPPDGGVPGSNPHFLIQDLIEPNNILYGILIPYQAGGLSAWADANEANVMAEAFNRFFIDHWLFDTRLRLTIVVSPLDPLAGAAEIRRAGRTSGVCAVRLPLINMLMGNRYYYPIYEAACELGLPIVLHGAGASFQGGPNRAGGVPATFAETYASVGLGGLASNNIASLVMEGVFERFPKLKVVFTEMDWAWVGPSLWKADMSWRSFRVMVPWLKKPPSEYILDHIRFTTQPMPEAPDPKQVLQCAEMMHAERNLMFATDYPHWNGDDPKLAFAGWPEGLKQQVFLDTALETFETLPVPQAPIPETVNA